MIALFSDTHELHAPAFEFFRGERVPCFETPARAAFVKKSLQQAGHILQQPHVTFEDDPISTFTLKLADFKRLGQRLAALGLPTVFVLEGGYAAEALGTNAVEVLDGFDQGA